MKTPRQTGFSILNSEMILLETTVLYCNCFPFPVFSFLIFQETINPVTDFIFNNFHRDQNPLEYEVLFSMYFVISCKNLHNELSSSFMNVICVCVYEPWTHAVCLW